MTAGPKIKNRFGQGNAVDRAKPHVFHRDYWPLRLIREGVSDFVSRYGAELRGKTAVDFGAGECPYAGDFESAEVELLRADIGATESGVLPIDAEGRVPLSDASAGAVISTQVLEHVANPEAYLAEAYRLLQPGGLLFLSTHGAFILHRVPTDYRRWTIDGLRYEIEQAGFEILSLEPRLGILATATHLRSITYGGILRRIPALSLLRPLLYLWFNCRMGIEQWITPASVMEAHPELIFAVARKPHQTKISVLPATRI